MMSKSMSFPLTVPNNTSNGGLDFSPQSPEFYSCMQFGIRKRLACPFLPNCEASSLTVFTTMYPKEQRTSDNLIVKDNCFIIEIFDKCNFSGILRRCLGYLNDLNKALKE